MRKIIVITGDEKRHLYLASRLSANFNVVSVFFEKKANKHTQLFNSTEEGEILVKHFEARQRSEEKYFGQARLSADALTLNLETGNVNSDEVFESIQNLNAEAIVLFGSSIINKRLLNEYHGKVINLHLGLSPFYRGSGTNFWPYVFNEPECVGATIHLAVSKVDAGAIIKQVRPNIEASDNMHDIGNKVIIEAADILKESINNYLSTKLQPIPQQLLGGRLCKRDDLNAEAIKTAYANFENGMLTEYLNNKNKRDELFPII
jgi:methionyl-tRNA formyltransferase